MNAKPALHAVVVAAGKGLRAGGGVPKQFRSVGGLPVLRRSVSVFQDLPEVKSLTVVIGTGQEELCRDALGHLWNNCRIVTGGDTRQASVFAGLNAIADIAAAEDIVLIHDGARAFASTDLIQRVIEGVIEFGAALPGVPVVDTLKRVDENGLIQDTVPRDPLRRGQTPQGFRFGALYTAHCENTGADWATDDSVMMEKLGQLVAVVPGEAGNVKLTTEEDFMEAEQRLGVPMEPRTGLGYDVHRFAEGDHVWLCGVRVSHDKSLSGHSDADVGLHAITDAVLGAIAQGDIGSHFPPTDPQWKGCASQVFLSHAADLVEKAGGRIINVDATLICERPKIGPHRDAMQSRVSEILRLSPGRVSVKATTTEKLGFTGRREGIACQAVATVLLPGSNGQ